MECIWLDEIESFPAYCITHRCGEAKRCGRDDCPHCKLRTSGGVELTDELIEQLADEAEKGYDVTRMKPRTHA